MSGWNDLARLGAVVRPVDQDWPHAVTPVGERLRSPFSSPLSSTVRTLVREIYMLGGNSIVIGLAIPESKIRQDGMPRADATTNDPRVMLAFESKWGPVQFATDVYTRWTENLRAIALSMEALRAVDRYGVSKRGEQYRGWKALTTGTDPADAIVTTDQAWRVICAAGGWQVEAGGEIVAVDDPEGAVRAAVKATHPDVKGGDATEFRRVMKAKEVLGL